MARGRQLVVEGAMPPLQNHYGETRTAPSAALHQPLEGGLHATVPDRKQVSTKLGT